MNKPHYFIRTKKEFENIPKAVAELHSNHDTMTMTTGYHMPQPVYKSWVPNWVIRLIIKS